MDSLIQLIPLPYTDAVVALGALVLGAVAGVLGCLAVLRERSLVGDALAHATLPGVCAAFLLVGSKDPLVLLAGGGVAALVAALLVHLLERSGRVASDAAIGVVLAGSFSLGIVLLTWIATLGNASQAGLERYLFGQAAGLTQRDVLIMLIIGGASVALLATSLRAVRVALFDRSFAAAVGVRVRLVELATIALLVAAIIIGVRMVGIILMVSMLVVPAVFARMFTERLAPMLWIAGACGAAVGVTGALISVRSGTPTGPVIVLVGVAFVMVAMLIAPERGLITSVSDRRRRAARVARESLLVQLHADPGAHGVTPSQLRQLQRAGLVAASGERDAVHVTPAGEAIVRARTEQHALWCAWLEHGWQLGIDDGNEPDPSDVRASIGDDRAERLLALARAEGMPS